LNSLEFILGGIPLRLILDLVRVAFQHSLSMSGSDLGERRIFRYA
jgi:hypothetical protein